MDELIFIFCREMEFLQFIRLSIRLVHEILNLQIKFHLATDPQESRSMISRSRSDPIGREGPASGQITQGVIGSAIDLNAQFGFDGSTTAEHSAQWTRPIQTSFPYYKQV